MDTIAAIATPSVPSAIGIVRISGPEALSVAEKTVRVGGKPAKDLQANTVRVGMLMQNGKIGIYILNIMVLVMLVLVYAVMLIKKIMNKQAEKEEG